MLIRCGTAGAFHQFEPATSQFSFATDAFDKQLSIAYPCPLTNITVGPSWHWTLAAWQSRTFLSTQLYKHGYSHVRDRYRNRLVAHVLQPCIAGCGGLANNQYMIFSTDGSLGHPGLTGGLSYTYILLHDLLSQFPYTSFSDVTYLHSNACVAIVNQQRDPQLCIY